MQRHHIFALVLAIAAVNGILSPWLAVVIAFAPIWYPTWLPNDPSLLFYLASLVTATATLLAGGVPAAIAERALRWPRESTATLWIWTLAALVLSLPGLSRLV